MLVAEWTRPGPEEASSHELGKWKSETIAAGEFLGRAAVVFSRRVGSSRLEPQWRVLDGRQIRVKRAGGT